MTEQCAHILAALKKRPGGYVSGTELASVAGVSRSAIWKQINKLREAGYGIEASTRLGYRLSSRVDRLLSDDFDGLGTECVGSRIVCYEKIDSTNNEAKRLAAQGAEDGCVVIAERQTGGRGRLGRTWFSPLGGLWLSLILRPEIAPGDAPKVVMLAACSVQAALRALGFEATIKWPNDLLLSGKKVSGILTEMAGQPELVDHIVLGIGINANIPLEAFSEELDATATSLLAEAGKEVDRVVLARRLLVELDARYRRLKRGDFAEILAEWRSACSTLGCEIELSTPTGIVRGRAVDVDELGSLILENAEGIRGTFSSGDVTVIKGEVR